MQALIDFDGWRKWKDFSQTTKPTALLEKKTTPSTGNIMKSPVKSPTNNGKNLQNMPKRDRTMSLNLGKENGTGPGSDGTGTGTEDTNGDSGSGNEAVVLGRVD